MQYGVTRAVTDIMEPYTYFITPIGVIASYLYLAIKGESFNPIKYFEYYRNGIQSSVYNKFEFNSSELELNKTAKENLIKETDKLKEELAANK